MWATQALFACFIEATFLLSPQVAGQFAGGVSEVRAGNMTQDVAVLTRMGDRFSTWDVSNGLRSIIPTLLTSGLLGAPDYQIPSIAFGCGEGAGLEGRSTYRTC